MHRWNPTGIQTQVIAKAIDSVVTRDLLWHDRRPVAALKRLKNIGKLQCPVVRCVFRSEEEDEFQAVQVRKVFL